MSRSGSARLALCALGCLLAFAGGCDDTAAAPTLEVQIIDGQGHNPLAPDSPVDRLRVTVSREGVEPLVYDAPVTAGSFDASVPLGSLVDPLSVQVELRAGDEVRLVGASPRFVPARSGGLLRVPVVPPGTCVTMPIANLAVARDGVSWGRVGDLVLFPEGVDDDHPSEGRVEVFDLVRAAMGPMPDPPLALAEGFIKALSDTKALAPWGRLANDVGSLSGYGWTSEFLSKYVREDKTLSLAEGVRRMTSLPAQRIGLRDRGLIREGYKADIVVFGPNTVSSTWSVKSPRTFAKGFEHVFVNGEQTILRGERTQTNKGRVLRGPFS